LNRSGTKQQAALGDEINNVLILTATDATVALGGHVMTLRDVPADGAPEARYRAASALGIDKPNIRYIVHYQAPGSLSSTFRKSAAPDATGDQRTASSCSTRPSSTSRSGFRL
jgi:hypothetical protein